MSLFMRAILTPLSLLRGLFGSLLDRLLDSGPGIHLNNVFDSLPGSRRTSGPVCLTGSGPDSLLGLFGGRESTF